MTVIVKHNKTNTITDWTQAQLDEQIALGNFPSGTTLANIVLPSDWNNDHTLTGLGTMAEQDATAVAITGGTINNTTIGATTATTGRFTSVTTPSVTATTNDLTLSAISTGAVNLATAGGTQFQIANTASATNYLATTGSNGGTPALYSAGASTNIGANIVSKGTGSVAFYTNGGVAQQVVSHTASAVNYVQVTGSATGQRPTISAQGSDSNINLYFQAKGSGQIQTAGWMQVGIGATNYWQLASASTGTAPILSSTGGDTNISMAFQPKGTGAIDLAAGSSGVNISNGGTVTAITRTSTGSGYTSFPTGVISAPTTAGGVQATFSFTLFNLTATIGNGGTGYTVGDVLTVTGGTTAEPAMQYTVATVSSGVVTAVTATRFTSYSAIPTNPASTTGGTGTGCTLNITYGLSSTSLTITNAGSGYIEQPTVTFSGGGGSGAAAYATVGSSVRLQSLGTTSELAFAFRGASGINSPTAPDILRILDVAAANDAGIFIQNSGFGRAQIQAYGNANANLFLCANGSGRVTFTTSGTSLVEQMRVSHTASAVNYVQVTGGATGTPATVTISGQGSSANIDLALTPKGTGLVKFGTYVAGALLATGYINIKAADGTTYKVLVST
jgi:hypothetical protein